MEIIIPETIVELIVLQGNITVIIGGFIFLLIVIIVMKFKIEKIEKRLKNLEEIKNGNNIR